MGQVKPKILLHICCAPCSTHVFRALAEEFEVVGFFYDPNIQPRAEYEARLCETRRLAESFGFKLITGEYDSELWNKSVSGLEGEREGGERCRVCYRVRLARAAEAARDEGCEYLATTLTVSPHKRAAVINPLGETEAKKTGVKFYAADFKKRDGFKKSCQLSNELGLYRQGYCGCLHSLREREDAKVEQAGDLSRPWPHGEGDGH